MTFKSKNTNHLYTIFVTTLTLLSLASCKTKSYNNYLVEGKKIEVNKNYATNENIESFIKPYRTHIDKDLDSVISYCPETLDKNKGEWQSNIGNFMADACFELANPIFLKRENKKIDITLFNNGGIRSIIPKGNITKRNAFEVMPFENSLIVVALKGEQIKTLAQHIITEKKPHPLNGLKIYLNSNSEITKILFEDKPIDNSKIYYVLTSDYLSNGGDNMTFFLKNEGTYDLNYKIRNVLIDYFYKYKSIVASNSPRIIKE
ncbi:5'-nucleotidase C-terminal domain-containing protein [Flavobacterium terrigena]|uniref:5'-nucleotidase, C-terminal domain n=1 Tax=Flavobacterium terrigena TaxID=402734 RepID=A0A1H6V466_9FLAO|nr:5'-nucleotidase [Flavobacterium terrigena]SEI95082.1 5'-nucleotidase, C-terminal domain [Flavobacterium terrigena]